MRRGGHLLVITWLVVIAGCSMTDKYQEGKTIDPQQVSAVKDGMTKAQLLQLLGNPSDTQFVELTPEDIGRQVRVKEIMVYRYSTDQIVTKPPILGGAATKTGTLQELQIGLEDGIVAYHNYTEGQQ